MLVEKFITKPAEEMSFQQSFTKSGFIEKVFRQKIALEEKFSRKIRSLFFKNLCEVMLSCFMLDLHKVMLTHMLHNS